MKKFLVTFCAVAFFGIAMLPFVACSEVNENPAVTEIREIRFDIQVNNASSPDTKVVKTTWENGDKVFVFFKRTAPDEAYLDFLYYVTLTYNAGTGKWDGAFSEGSSQISKIGTAGVMYAVYFPFGNVQRTASGFHTSGFTNGALNGIYAYSYFMTNGEGSNYTMTSGGDIATLSGNLDLALPANMVYFYVDAQGGKYNENEKYRLSVAGVRPVAVTSWYKGTFETSGLGAGQPMWGYKYGNGIAFAGVIDDSWSSPADHKCYFFSDGDPAVTKTLTNKTLSGHATVNLDVTNGWTKAMPVPKYTKMCDGNYWGRWNLGCEDTDDDSYGAVFRWGEIVPNGSGGYFPLSIISTHPLVGNYAIYDAARAMLGENWRMPTKEEMEFLKEESGNCTNTYEAAGVPKFGNKRGWVCTGKSEPTNSIFFRTNGSNDGVYWTATSPNSSYAISCRFTDSWFASFENSDRTALKAIRPIYCGPVSD